MVKPNPVRFRETEYSLLSSFIANDSHILVPHVIVQGYKSVGKTFVVKSFLDDIGINKTIVNCDEFLTQKLLLQKCLHRIKQDSGIDLDKYQQRFMYKGLEASRESVLCETFSQFLMTLEQFIDETNYREPHVLVLDRFDQCLDQTNELFRAFLKLREYSSITNIIVIYITSHEDPKEIAPFVIPHVHFPPYTQESLVEILADSRPKEVTEGLIDVSAWQSFSKLVVDSLFHYTGTDLSLIKDICSKSWPKFSAQCIESGQGNTGFLKALRSLRDEIFQDDIITNSSVVTFGGLVDEKGSNSSLGDLPYHSKFILIASYLASYTDVKLDIQLFSRVKTAKKRPRKKTNSSRADAHFMSAAYFDLERLKAILSVIYRNESLSLSRNNEEFLNLYHDLSEKDLAKKEAEFTYFTPNKSVDVNTQIATLLSLGMIDRTYSLDALSSRIRWKCNVSWDIISSLAEDIRFPLHNYMIDN
ncbi:hypothetical protein PUMCH_000348 [Australozyma saopauloensis]|uniref:Orc1-like AAA ATPase domain-containing protein n=1 Tax=Australozyma saopauloensis TaxID=291208 RepID=A0AAX4H3L4_9ASCO|nr:hypothetical protein PUMCH_000348 [[Candida] saopauloensis]